MLKILDKFWRDLLQNNLAVFLLKTHVNKNLTHAKIKLFFCLKLNVLSANYVTEFNPTSNLKLNTHLIYTTQRLRKFCLRTFTPRITPTTDKFTPNQFHCATVMNYVSKLMKISKHRSEPRDVASPALSLKWPNLRALGL